MLRRVSFDRTSYGIPIGPAASRPIAEAALIDIDDALTSFEIEFIRYIDDFYLFANTRDEAEWGLRKLGEILSANHGLSLQSAKTKIQTTTDFLTQLDKRDGVEDDVDAAFDKIVDDHFYDMKTLDELTEEERESLDALDLGQVLEEELDEEDIDYKKVSFILDKLSSLERPDLIPIVLSNLPRLYPVAHAIHAFFRDFATLEAVARDEAAEALLAPIEATGKARAPEFYAIWILDLFRRVPVWNHRSRVHRIFRDTQSQAVRRYAALALGPVGGRAEALALKDAIHSAEPLTRTAIILASKKLGVDERKYWLQELELDPFEKLLVKYC
jgi:Reverse transcriptase (RNA-dependent DNA polymerase)